MSSVLKTWLAPRLALLQRLRFGQRDLEGRASPRFPSRMNSEWFLNGARGLGEVHRARFEARGSSGARRGLARPRQGTAPLPPPLESSDPPLPRGLTNEVQRRAKRVRCNAGLGCWCPQAACSLRILSLSGAWIPCAVRDPDDRASADAREVADVGTTNLEPVPLRVAAQVVGAPWLRNRATARRWSWWLRARLPRPARNSDAADMPTVDSEPGTPLTSRDGALESAAPEPDGCHEAIETTGSQNVSRVRARTAFARLAFRLESSLTNEAQRRASVAKRVSCSAGLGPREWGG